MAEKIVIDGFTITELVRLFAFNRVTNLCELYLTELKSTKVSNTEDTVDITGKGDRVLKQIRKNKGVTVEGESAYISGGLMAAQTGAEETTEDVNVEFPDVIDITSEIVTNKSLTTTFTAVGTAGAEIKDVRIMSDNGGLIVNTWKQGATAGEGVYAYDPKTKVLALPTDADITEGQKIVVFYKYHSDGTKVVNKSDEFGKTLCTIIDCVGSDVCDNEYKCQIIIYRAQFSGQFDIDMGGDQVIHSFSATSLVDTCAKTSTNGLWEFIVYKDEYKEDTKSA